MAEDSIQQAKDLVKLERRIARAEAALVILRTYRAQLLAALSGATVAGAVSS